LRQLGDTPMAVQMPRKFAERLASVAPSATLAMAARAANLRAGGHKVYAFGVGEPDFAPPTHVLQAAKDALDNGATHYTAVSGTPDLKAAICEATERFRRFRVTPEEIVVSCGVKHVLFNLALALFEPGDEVIIPAPFWVSYPEQARMVGASPVIVETREDEGFRLSAEVLAAAISPRTKAIVLCSPSNPTGAAYGEEHLRPLLDVLRRHDCWIIVDEIYADLTYDGFQHVSLPALAPDLRERMVIVDGVSKTYAMTGFRIGWSIAPAALSRAIDTVQGQSTTNAAAVSQAAAVAALRGPRGEVDTMREVFARRRGIMVEGLRGTPGVRCRMPEGAFYAFADVRGLYGIPWKGKPLASDEDVAGWLLDQAHVATVAGTPFGAPGYLRISYACSEDDIQSGLSAIRGAVAAAR